MALQAQQVGACNCRCCVCLCRMCCQAGNYQQKAQLTSKREHHSAEVSAVVQQLQRILPCLSMVHASTTPMAPAALSLHLCCLRCVSARLITALGNSLAWPCTCPCDCCCPVVMLRQMLKRSRLRCCASLASRSSQTSHPGQQLMLKQQQGSRAHMQ